MWFRALRLWRLRAPWTLSRRGFDQPCGSALHACGPGQPNGGWAPLLEEEDGAHVLSQGPFQLCCLRTQERILPKAAIMELLERLQRKKQTGYPLRASGGSC